MCTKCAKRQAMPANPGQAKNRLLSLKAGQAVREDGNAPNESGLYPHYSGLPVLEMQIMSWGLLAIIPFSGKLE